MHNKNWNVIKQKRETKTVFQMLKVNWKLWKGKNEYRGHSQGLVGLGAIVVQLSC